jgi:uncharacterized protein YcbX
LMVDKNDAHLTQRPLPRIALISTELTSTASSQLAKSPSPWTASVRRSSSAADPPLRKTPGRASASARSPFAAAAPAARCIVTTTDQFSGERGHDPLRTLATYRTLPIRRASTWT